jgi:hypothetical protein
MSKTQQSQRKKKPDLDFIKSGSVYEHLRASERTKKFATRIYLKGSKWKQGRFWTNVYRIFYLLMIILHTLIFIKGNNESPCTNTERGVLVTQMQ